MTNRYPVPISYADSEKSCYSGKHRSLTSSLKKWCEKRYLLRAHFSRTKSIRRNVVFNCKRRLQVSCRADLWTLLRLKGNRSPIYRKAASSDICKAFYSERTSENKKGDNCKKTMIILPTQNMRNRMRLFWCDMNKVLNSPCWLSVPLHRNLEKKN